MDTLFSMLKPEAVQVAQVYFQSHPFNPNKLMDYYSYFETTQDAAVSLDKMNDEFKDILDAEKQRFNPVIEEGAFTCPNCKSRKVTTRQVQMRSGDEGANTLLTCHNCGKQWIR